MTTTIYDCKFNLEGNFDSLQPIHNASNISSLVNQIVTTDFNYSANSKYTLSLKNTDGFKGMLLEVWDDQNGASKHKHAELKFIQDQWFIQDLTQPDQPDRLINRDPTVITGRLSETLYRIGQLHIPREEAVQGFQTLMDRNLSALDRILDRLERLPGDRKESREEGLERVQVLERLVGDLKETLASEIPLGLRAIEASIREMHGLLRGLNSGKSDTTFNSTLEDIKREVREIKDQYVPLVHQQQNEELESLKSQLKEAQQECDMVFATAATQKMVNEELESRIEELHEVERQLEVATGTIGELRSEFAGAQVAEEDGLEKIRKLQAEINGMKAQLTDVSNDTEMSDLKAQLAASEKAQQVSKETIRELGSTLARQKQEIAKAYLAADKAEAAAEKANQASRQIQSKLIKTESQLEETQKQLEETDRILREKTRKADKAERALETLRSKYEESRKEWDAYESDQRIHIDKIQERLLALKKQNAEQSDEIVALKKSLQEATHQLNEEALQRKSYERTYEIEHTKLLEQLQQTAVKTPIVFDARNMKPVPKFFDNVEKK